MSSNTPFEVPYLIELKFIRAFFYFSFPPFFSNLLPLICWIIRSSDLDENIQISVVMQSEILLITSRGMLLMHSQHENKTKKYLWRSRDLFFCQ